MRRLERTSQSTPTFTYERFATSRKPASCMKRWEKRERLARRRSNRSQRLFVHARVVVAILVCADIFDDALQGAEQVQKSVGGERLGSCDGRRPRRVHALC